MHGLMVGSSNRPTPIVRWQDTIRKDRRRRRPMLQIATNRVDAKHGVGRSTMQPAKMPRLFSPPIGSQRPLARNYRHTRPIRMLRHNRLAVVSPLQPRLTAFRSPFKTVATHGTNWRHSSDRHIPSLRDRSRRGKIGFGRCAAQFGSRQASIRCRSRHISGQSRGKSVSAPGTVAAARRVAASKGGSR